MKIARSPNGLKSAGARFWKRVLSEFVLENGHDLARLELACNCLDEIQEAEKVIEKEGRFVTDRWNQKKEHPASKMIQNQKIIFLRCVRELGLDIVNPSETRPPGRY